MGSLSYTVEEWSPIIIIYVVFELQIANQYVGLLLRSAGNRLAILVQGLGERHQKVQVLAVVVDIITARFVVARVLPNVREIILDRMAKVFRIVLNT